MLIMLNVNWTKETKWRDHTGCGYFIDWTLRLMGDGNKSSLWQPCTVWSCCHTHTYHILYLKRAENENREEPATTTPLLTDKLGFLRSFGSVSCQKHCSHQKACSSTSHYLQPLCRSKKALTSGSAGTVRTLHPTPVQTASESTSLHNTGVHVKQ